MDHLLPPVMTSIMEHPPSLFNALSIITLTVLFWPILSNLFVSIFIASSWIIWIIFSLFFGTIQFGYVIYQFFRISFDIGALILLKTFAMLRSQVLYCCSSVGVSRRKKRNKRREWRRRVMEAKGFDDFCKIGTGELIEDISATTRKILGKSLVRSFLKSFDSLDSDVSSVESDSVNEDDKDVADSVNSAVGANKIHTSRSCVNFPIHTLETNTNQPRRARSQVDLESHSSKKLSQNPTSEFQRTTLLLRQARKQFTENSDPYPLKFNLSGVVKRNHLGLDDLLIDDAHHVAEGGRHSLSSSSRTVLDDYITEVEDCLSVLNSPSKHLPLLHKLKQNVGSTALMLSGGGSQAMNHLGILKALVEGGVYDRIKVISGTSGGSAVAGMCATKTSKELLEEVCIPTMSTQYGGPGVMAQKGIRWSPTIPNMIKNWWKTGLLFESKDFKRLNYHYFGDITFEEAFQKTKKHVCISVTASRAVQGGGGRQRLLLNHISTPHVTIGSAVGASCALPGVMPPAKLQAKDSSGNIVPFEVDGLEWIDGSVQADIPFQRISTLFNVNNYIVSQVNFHVVPFLHKPHHPSVKSLYWRLFQLYEWDIRNRALNLGRLGLFPKLFGQDVSKMFKQKYHGNITIVPHFTKLQVFGLKVLISPSVADMEIYIRNGEVATWPYVKVIGQILRLETAIETSLRRLFNSMETNNTTNCDISKSSAATPGKRLHSQKNSINDAKIKTLETEKNFLDAENKFLRERVEWLERELLRQKTESDTENETCSPPNS